MRNASFNREVMSEGDKEEFLHDFDEFSAFFSGEKNGFKHLTPADA